MATVKISKPEQFQHENKTWSRLLEFFKQENTFLKNRLAEVVDHSTDKDFLALAEHFQNKFIIKDEYIDELRHDINAQEQVLIKKDNILLDGKTIKKQERLRNEMEYLEKDFANLKNEFNKYLSSVL
ncbi:MAG: hypothetical protein ABI666_01750 [Ferruginibacter sp.]